MKTILYLYLLFIVLAAILPINGSNSSLNNNYLLEIRWDYILHALVFVPLVPLIMLIRGEILLLQKSSIFIIVLLSFVLASLLEGVQYLLSYRAFNLNDLAANGVGVSFGFLLYLVLKKNKTVAV